MSTIEELPTPAFLIDLDVAERNCAAMLDKARRSAVVLRPHIKTHKTLEGAYLQLGGSTGPITVSTLAEAEFFAEAGFRDITYAFPIAPGKIERVARIRARGNQVHVLADHADTITALEEYAAAHDIRFSVFLKVDCGYHRAGVDPISEEALALGSRIAHSRVLDLAGLLTHGGHSYYAANRDQISYVAREEVGALRVLADRLRAAEVDPGLSSLGSTPTASVTDGFEGCDEVRPGNYIFFDAFQASIGACTLDDCAATVLTTVVSTYPARREVLVDAGALAMSKDLGGSSADDPSYGTVLVEGSPRKDLRFRGLSQEHGEIAAESGRAFRDLKVGQKLRVIMNHSCLTAALFDRYHVIRGDTVVGEWRPVRGW